MKKQTIIIYHNMDFDWGIGQLNMLRTPPLHIPCPAETGTLLSGQQGPELQGQQMELMSGEPSESVQVLSLYCQQLCLLSSGPEKPELSPSEHRMRERYHVIHEHNSAD